MLLTLFFGGNTTFWIPTKVRIKAMTDKVPRSSRATGMGHLFHFMLVLKILKSKHDQLSMKSNALVFNNSQSAMPRQSLLQAEHDGASAP